MRGRPKSGFTSSTASCAVTSTRGSTLYGAIGKYLEGGSIAAVSEGDREVCVNKKNSEVEIKALYNRFLRSAPNQIGVVPTHAI